MNKFAIAEAALIELIEYCNIHKIEIIALIRKDNEQYVSGNKCKEVSHEMIKEISGAINRASF